MTSSALSPKIIYIIVPQVKNLICEMWANNSKGLKSCLSFMSKGDTTYPKKKIFFIISINVQKYFVTYFVPDWL